MIWLSPKHPWSNRRRRTVFSVNQNKVCTILHLLRRWLYYIYISFLVFSIEWIRFWSGKGLEWHERRAKDNTHFEIKTLCHIFYPDFKQDTFQRKHKNRHHQHNKFNERSDSWRPVFLYIYHDFSLPFCLYNLFKNVVDKITRSIIAIKYKPSQKPERITIIEINWQIVM